MKNNKPIIGILAGMGPKSTAPFIDLVIEQCQKQYGAKNDIDFPHIIIYSLPTPFFVNKKLDDKEMKRVISKGLQKLESAGVGFIAMPCNTAHKYFSSLQHSIKIPLLNIIDSTTENINEKSQKVTLFATDQTIKADLYQSRMKKQKLRYVLKKEWQQEVNSLIVGVKKGEGQTKLLAITKRLSRFLKEDNIDTIIIVCTDLTKIVKTMKGFTLIDSSEALAQKTIETYLKMQSTR